MATYTNTSRPQEDFNKAKNQAGQMLDTAKDKASDVASNVADKAKDVASNVADRAKNIIPYCERTEPQCLREITYHSFFVVPANLSTVESRRLIERLTGTPTT